MIVLIVAAGALTAAWGIGSRARAMTTLAHETDELAIPTVAVMRPQRGATQQTISLPGTIQAYTDAAIYARTNGYLKARYADIGSHVRAGQLLADIDTPEIEQQLQQARADLATAQANLKLALTTAERYRDLIKTESVSQQDVDNANGSYEAKRTAVDSAEANVKRLEQLHAFRKIYAPFDGVITARNTDVGALIQSGSNAKELFHVAATKKLRVFVNLPEVYSRAARSGLDAYVTLKEYGARRFKGTLARTAQAIDVTSRTLLVEIDMNNPSGELLPGSYAEVHLTLPAAVPAVRLPVNALIFRADGLRVALVRHDRIELQPVTLGEDDGNEVEVVDGVTPHDLVVVNPPDSLEEGETVRVAAGSPDGARP
ncbi:MAG TPA: efflux RND transporter periplasmic adaptor subunit [Vicinamibacterales bacterium]|nr:efflux RND transporter periplasmic adaptor subunit [Vicinamibacterales bacterium]